MSKGAFADDTFLISTCIQRHQVLLNISEHQTATNNIRNVPTKTHLIILNPQTRKNQIPSIDPASALNMGSTSVSISPEAKHLGITRSSDGKNVSAIATRLSAHDSSLFSLLSAGHKSNPLVILKVLKLYCTPVLLSGIPSLVLINSDYNLIDTHYKKTLQRVMRLHSKTPETVLYFLSGCPQIKAQIHQRMFSHLHMTAVLGPTTPLYKIGISTLHASGNPTQLLVP